MKAGSLDRKITIQAVTFSEPDDYGSVHEAWTDKATVAAYVQQESGREFMSGPGLTQEKKALFRLRWMDGIDVTMRILYAGRIWDVHDVKELGRREGLELHASTQDL